MRQIIQGLLLAAACLQAQMVISPKVEADSQSLAAVAVMDFEGRGLPNDQAVTLADRFRAELSGCGGIRQVERSKMNEILREQGFQQTGCTSTECAVQTGRLLGVGQMISGSVSRIGETWTVHARVIDVGTAEILKTAIVDQRGPIDDLLTSGMAQLAQKLVGGCQGSLATPNVEVIHPVVLPVVAPSPQVPPVPTTAVAVDTPQVPNHDLSQFQIALLSPFVIPRGEMTHGVAIDLLYGRLDSLRGVQAGVFNEVMGPLKGVQAGLVNIAGEVHGVQGGIYNFTTGELDGIQGGVSNFAVSSRGLQAGVVNITEHCNCLQFGLINIWKSSDGHLRVSPIIGGFGGL